MGSRNSGEIFGEGREGKLLRSIDILSFLFIPISEAYC